MASHYVYKLLREDTGEFYIGVRSVTGIKPEHDLKYMGSGQWAKAARRARIKLRKQIIQKFRIKDRALNAESRLILANRHDPLCRNLDFVKRIHRTLAYTSLAEWDAAIKRQTIPDPLFPISQHKADE